MTRARPRIALVLAWVGAFAGCWTSSPPAVVEPVPPPPTVVRRSTPTRSPCEVTIDHVVEVMHDELARIPDFAEQLEAIRGVAVASCNETRWTPELHACFDQTTDNSAIQECQALFTPDQTADLMRRMTEVLTGLNAPPPPTP